MGFSYSCFYNAQGNWFWNPVFPVYSSILHIFSHQMSLNYPNSTSMAATVVALEKFPLFLTFQMEFYFTFHLYHILPTYAHNTHTYTHTPFTIKILLIFHILFIFQIPLSSWSLSLMLCLFKFLISQLCHELIRNKDIVFLFSKGHLRLKRFLLVPNILYCMISWAKYKLYVKF